jgi:hypothetical protein
VARTGSMLNEMNYIFYNNKFILCYINLKLITYMLYTFTTASNFICYTFESGKFRTISNTN